MGEDSPVRMDSRWQLGSITKPFVATLVAILVEEGKLHWEDTLGNLFSELSGEMTPDAARITVKHLLCHKSGLMRDGQAFVATQSGLSPTERRYRFVSRVLKEPLLRPPGLQYSYSNVGYVVLSVLTERVTGKPWGNSCVSG